MIVTSGKEGYPSHLPQSAKGITGDCAVDRASARLSVDWIIVLTVYNPQRKTLNAEVVVKMCSF